MENDKSGSYSKLVTILCKYVEIEIQVSKIPSGMFPLSTTAFRYQNYREKVKTDWNTKNCPIVLHGNNSQYMYVKTVFQESQITP